MDDACPSDATCSFHCYHHECACDEGFVPTVRLYFYLILNIPIVKPSLAEPVLE